jgi:hypothetical protein
VHRLPHCALLGQDRFGLQRVDDSFVAFFLRSAGSSCSVTAWPGLFDELGNTVTKPNPAPGPRPMAARAASVPKVTIWLTAS